MDVLLGRDPYANAAAQVLDRAEAGLDRGFIAWHSPSNIYYVVGGPKAAESYDPDSTTVCVAWREKSHTACQPMPWCFGPDRVPDQRVKRWGGNQR
ncbi:MAG: hypothetical protein AAF654_14895 [Myxococcota bacterium]